jgi:hypothetical protein
VLIGLHLGGMKFSAHNEWIDDHTYKYVYNFISVFPVFVGTEWTSVHIVYHLSGYTDTQQLLRHHRDEDNKGNTWEKRLETKSAVTNSNNWAEFKI